MMTKLRSGQGKRDDADADAEATDQSNTFVRRHKKADDNHVSVLVYVLK